MIKVVFLLGRPGSGKSCVACAIKRIAELRSWTTRHLFDYQLLQDMFLQEERGCSNNQEKKFRRRGLEEHNGFDVLDFEVLDTVLDRMAEQVRAEKESQKLFLIEFARRNYTQALSHFSPDILQGAHLLYLNADLETCIERVHRRIDNPTIECGRYNHFVSDFIMQGYYYRDDWEEVAFNIPPDWNVRVHPIKLDNNIDERQTLTSKVERWADNAHLFSDRMLERPEQSSLVLARSFSMVSPAEKR
jgi:adenylate kinase family enzyme